jgi:hypothetical protein
MATDRWSVGYWVRYDSSVSLPTPTQANTYAANIGANFASVVWSVYKAQNDPATTLDVCSVRFYSSGVLMVNGTATITSVPGTGSGAHPCYVACCVSMLSAFPGRSKRGRMYLPATAYAVTGTTGQWTTAGTATTTVANLASHLTNSAHTPGWGSPAAFSPVVLSKTLGSTSDIVSLRIDSLPDTQHGRTRSLVALATATHTVP